MRWRGRKPLAALAIAVVAAGLVIAWRLRGTDVVISSAPHLPPTRVVNYAVAGRTRLPLRASNFLPYACQPAFGDLTFFDPVYVAPLADGSGRMVVVERRGTVQIVEHRAGKPHKLLLLDLAPRVRLTPDRAEEGLLGLAFHPRYADRSSPHCGKVFVHYCGMADGGPVNRLSRLAAMGSRLDLIDAASEVVLIEQPDRFQGHNGGSVQFGPDGMLYVSLGDDAEMDPNPHAQQIDHDLFSGILRLDVDGRGGAVSHRPPRQPQTGRTRGYLIPSDNPFVGQPGALEEFYAFGLRNPWRMSFDRATGRLYAADAGDRRREEINLIRPGSNCGWNFAEGTLATRGFRPTAPKRPAKLVGIDTPPLFEYARDAAHRCVIGGYVYRGRECPELVGKYVYADQSGRVYALELLDDGTRAGTNELVAVLGEDGVGISALGEDEQGELYLCTIGRLATETGRVFRLRPADGGQRDEMPATLVETGVFADWKTLSPRKEFVAYDVVLPFWADGAEKRRWVSVPKGKQISLVGGKVAYPPGTVFVKHFDIAGDERPSGARRHIETRVLICDDEGGVHGATYRWRDSGGPPRLVTFNETESIGITHGDGTATAQDWTYPGRFECALCHNRASGNVLGFVPRQLDRDVMVDGIAAPQLPRLAALGVISAEMGRIVLPDAARLVGLDHPTASAEHRVRSYLDVNCAACHNPNQRFAAFDARLTRPLGEQGLVDGRAHYHKDLGDDVRIVRPGDVRRSMLHLRMAAHDPCLRMPPLGSAAVDRQAVAAMAQWIGDLAPPVASGAESAVAR